MGYPQYLNRTHSPSSIRRYSPKRQERLPRRSNPPIQTVSEKKYLINPREHYAISDFRNALHLIANERNVRSVPQLALSQDLVQMAQNHAQWMAGHGTVRRSSEVVAHLAKFWKRAGQNVARAHSCEEAHAKMMADAGNGSRIVEWGYTHVGVGVARGSDGTVYVCQLFRT
mmetsp:Transcript_13603/g.30012  ORF Transcript_13603/g.30012 Transcript_13603/m.30012 type:complete len:171 (-) Transcript_13603:297-809(-)|eukprot:CAMPEP_0113321434 /NCGR_PEP_ID=MMETSP0010_2-20120614/14923_1 /TAXON_ID=216773 ORGANISM="Corethron hystrix, Strain 308" /NCGR_SAMPLE_ID=MMETSP0010_2 /ASSEMBLY_ACC=CAM_ASM_000155 /LENGTH=170 /DNA_ID=CAMNT_0000179573 /DNA_START=80 /DNA_END=592 /DNA_ORIENTATION=+ /assembly_acc=CAM_ASM_000155